MFLLLITVGWLLASIFSAPWHNSQDDGPPIFVRIFLFLFAVFVVIFVTRRVRRLATPLVDVMAGADRVAAGDYRIRLKGTVQPKRAV